MTGAQTVVNINNLHPAKAYHIRMAAENKLGSSEFSEIVQITTLEEGNYLLRYDFFETLEECCRKFCLLWIEK